MNAIWNGGQFWREKSQKKKVLTWTNINICCNTYIKRHYTCLFLFLFFHAIFRCITVVWNFCENSNEVRIGGLLERKLRMSPEGFEWEYRDFLDFSPATWVWSAISKWEFEFSVKIFEWELRIELGGFEQKKLRMRFFFSHKSFKLR